MSVGTKGWNGTLEYFNNFDLALADDNWATWDGSEITSGLDVDNTGNYCILLKGTGNTKIAGNGNNKFVLTGSNISCDGNIETLLDYGTVVNGGHPTMTNYCYSYMFFGCMSLITVPELPATTLFANCYSYMFYGCSKLTTLRKLPAINLVEQCYAGMFYGCTALKLSSSQTGEYTQAYRIPSVGTGISKYNSMTNMFFDTGGTFTGDPQINTTYYLSNTNTIV